MQYFTLGSPASPTVRFAKAMGLLSNFNACVLGKPDANGNPTYVRYTCAQQGDKWVPFAIRGFSSESNFRCPDDDAANTRANTMNLQTSALLDDASAVQTANPAVNRTGKDKTLWSSLVDPERDAPFNGEYMAVNWECFESDGILATTGHKAFDCTDAANKQGQLKGWKSGKCIE